MCVAKDFNLTPKQWLFCNEYVACHCNGKQAYSNVYPKANDETARKNASKLLTNNDIRKCIDKLLSEVVFDKKAIISQITDNLIQIATGQLDEETTIDNGTSTKLIKNKARMCDRVKASEILMKLFNAFETTTSTASDEEIEDFKEQAETSVEQVEGFEDDK